jgi:hypothetical protein
VGVLICARVRPNCSGSCSISWSSVNVDGFTSPSPSSGQLGSWALAVRYSVGTVAVCTHGSATVVSFGSTSTSTNAPQYEELGCGVPNCVTFDDTDVFRNQSESKVNCMCCKRPSQLIFY